jgi:hypothetical protein
LLKATSLAATTDALVRVKSYYPDVDMAKVKVGPDAEKDLAALELEVRWRTLWTMRVMTVTSSLGLGAVPPPLLSLVNIAS